MTVQERDCRACKGQLKSVFDMGEMTLSTFPIGEVGVLPSAPLDLCRCEACGLVQLQHTVEADVLFRQYWYLSGVNETMRAELANVVKNAMVSHGSVYHGDIVVDVGANDGTLLSNYPSAVVRVAYEPAENLQVALRKNCDAVIPDYFNSQHIAPRSVSILTSIACFYAVDDPMEFVATVDRVLTGKGIWVVQFQDLVQMLEATAFDDICHEHLFYPSLASTERMLDSFDLHIIDAERRAINGGSLRLTIGRKWRKPTAKVAELREAEVGCEDESTLTMFAARAQQVRNRIRKALLKYETIDLYGAPTKGNTLLQFCELDRRWLRQAWERSPEKWGRQTVTGIPIVSETKGRKDSPDALFVGIWQFKDAIIKREAEYLANGGVLIFPLPKVEVIGGDDVLEDIGARADARATG